MNLIHLAVQFVNRNWPAISGVSIVYLFFTSVISTFLYYRQFGIEPFIYFEMMDYPRILIKDNKVPYIPFLSIFWAILAVALGGGFLAGALKKGMAKNTCEILSIIFWLIFGYSLLFLPGLQAIDLAKNTKIDSKNLVEVSFGESSIGPVVLVGGSSKYQFFYDVKKSRSIVVRSDAIELIQTFAPAEATSKKGR